MSASAAPGVKSALRDLLQERESLADVKFLWAGPSSAENLPKRMIWFGKTEQDSEWAFLGARQRKEEFVQRVVVYQRRDGDDPESCEQDCWSIVSEIEDAILDDPTLGDLLSDWAEVQRIELETVPATESAWHSEAVLGIRCKARIRRA